MNKVLITFSRYVIPIVCIHVDIFFLEYFVFCIHLFVYIHDTLGDQSHFMFLAISSQGMVWWREGMGQAWHFDTWHLFGPFVYT